MKKLLAFAALFAVVALTSCKYDDDDLWNSVHGLENRVAKLEELCKQMNTNISSLQTIVTALQNNVYVTGTTPLMKDGKEIGYTITFSKGNPITIYHGKDGQDGEDGITPTISVKKDTDGVYYWTLNGEFIVVDGGKIQAEGKDGTNGTTPQFKIENDYWFVSYNNGANWTQLGKATGEDGIGGDSMFSGVDYETSTDYVIFTLSNGTQIKLPTWSAFEALQRLCNETNTNLSALQTIVTALQNNDYITSVDPLTENGKVVGYTIKFAKSNPIVIYNGKDGADGVDGNTPVIGVKKDTDGIYYWTLDGEFIVVDGQKIKAQGTDGNNGADGSDGVTPKLEIQEGYWWISYDNGTNWTQLGKATGEDGKDADSIKITQDENNVYFELADGTVITMPQNNDTTTQNIQFADPITKYLCSSQWLNSSNIDNLNSWDKNLDGELSYQEAANVKYIGYYHYFHGSAISSFNELRYFIGVTYIGKEAFKDCSKLYTIVIPDNVKTIEQNAFSGCSDLQFVTWGNNITDIQDRAFYGCTSLRFIILGDYVETIGAYAFYGASSINISTLRVTLPASVKSIGDYAFHNRNVEFVYCKSLTPPFLGGANVFGNDWGTSWKCKYQIPFENTLFINACVGLLIIPQQSLFNHLPTEVVSADKWGIADTDISCIKEPNKSVKNVARHIRNAIAHDGIRFGSDNGKDITHIKITDWKDERHKTETFKAVIEVTKFKTFVWAFAQFALTQQSLFKSQN